MSSEAETQIGRVKWFNTKAGYGFISYPDSDGKDVDVFTHHSSIKTSQEQFRYLVQGEYVSFVVETIQEPREDEHSTTATCITGVNGGMLMCETRNSFEARGSEQTSQLIIMKNDSKSVRGGGSGSSGRGRGRGRGGGRGHHNNKSNTPHNSFDN